MLSPILNMAYYFFSFLSITRSPAILLFILLEIYIQSRSLFLPINWTSKVDYGYQTSSCKYINVTCVLSVFTLPSFSITIFFIVS